jgi:hypothetical protein
MLRKISIVLILLLSLSVFPQPAHAAGLADYPVVPLMRGNVYYRARYLYRVGLRIGNRANVFSKIGDSITAFPYFLTPVGTGGLRLAEHPEVGTAAAYFSKAIARTNNSFANESLGAYPGWTTFDLLNPAKATPGICNGGATPVDCELGVSKPAVALIMIGTNDLPAVDVNTYTYNLNRIVTIVESHGVIPVLSTLPRRKGDPNSVAKLDAFNQAIVSIAQAHNAPLWNYWLAMESLPANGISTDLVHPSLPPDGNTAIFDSGHLSYGWTMRNLTALQVLNSVMSVLR